MPLLPQPTGVLVAGWRRQEQISPRSSLDSLDEVKADLSQGRSRRGILVGSAWGEVAWEKAVTTVSCWRDPICLLYTSPSPRDS